MTSRLYDPFRLVSSSLTPTELERIKSFKVAATHLHALLEPRIFKGAPYRHPRGATARKACLEEARRKLEEAVMWAVKGMST